MSHNDYVIGREISAQDYPFYALIQAAMRQADTDNLKKLREAWPDVYEELRSRYWSFQGRLPGDSESEEL